ncbi:MAG: T9SS type A sorting domain-containing protein [candidate division KSB1 bacterium]|nr:T9SS type A sorting domain-containing protein [candidate division KSB1 bacterium]
MNNYNKFLYLLRGLVVFTSSKKKAIIRYSFTFIFFVLCKTTYGQDYFPLEIGNRWIYERTDINGYDIYEITDTVSMNDKDYYCFYVRTIGSPWGEETHFEYYRKDSLNQVWIKSYTPQDEHIVYKLNVPQGAVWHYHFNDFTYKYTLMDTGVVIHTPAGLFEHCYYYNTLIEEIHTDFRDVLAPDVGLVRRISEGEGAILKGACVNGAMYGDTTITNVETVEEIPFVGELLNYPNPFNINTTIKFSLNIKIPQDIRLTIFDLTGKEVIKLFDNKQRAGNYSVVWDGKNKSGKEVSSGVYIYKLAVGKFLESRKLIVTK